MLRRPVPFTGLSALLALALSACASPPMVDSPRLWGTAWRLVELGGQPVLERPAATLSFPEPGRAVGQGSCNRFFGNVTLEGQGIRFGHLGATRMACPEVVERQEQRYLKALASVERVELDGDTLRLHGDGISLRLVRERP